MASAVLLARLRHDAERVIRARMASPTPPAGTRDPRAGRPLLRGPLTGDAELVEADDVQGQFVEAVKQPVELGLVPHRGHNGRPASARLDREPFDQARQQIPAILPDHDPVAEEIGRASCRERVCWIV